jgi:D-3-phosphoglycerate dehydrogenase / 2-oxoglutarate reductase
MTTRPQILLGPSTFGENDVSPRTRLFSAGFDLLENPYKRKLTKTELLGLLGRDVVGLIAGLETIDREVLRKSNLKVVSRCGSGMSNVDQDSAREFGIKVFNTPDGPTRAVAELTVGCLLSLIRQVPAMDRALHNEKKWNKRVGRQLKGMTVLIIGYGRIGRMVAQLLRAFETDIIVCDPSVTEATFPMKTCDEGLPLADVISLHLSGEKEVLGRREFELVKPGVFILNASRGGVLDEDALQQAIDAGRVRGAWIDTFGQEPYNGPLTSYDQVILTPHVGSYTHEGRVQMELDAAENLIRGFNEAMA